MNNHGGIRRMTYEQELATNIRRNVKYLRAMNLADSKQYSTLVDIANNIDTLAQQIENSHIIDDSKHRPTWGNYMEGKLLEAYKDEF